MLITSVIIVLLPLSAHADKQYDELKQQVELLQQQLAQVQLVLKKYEQNNTDRNDQVQQLAQEVNENSKMTAAMEEIKKELSDASEWRNPNTLIHMSGYADIGYSSDNESFSVGTFSPIFHYQYKDFVMLEAELELEVADTGETEIGLEYMTIDLFLNDNITFIGGRFLSPIGQFRQNLHPSWINKLVSAPPGFGHDGAAPTSEMGFQLRGGFEMGNTFANYAFYVSNGPELVSVEENEGEFALEGIDAEGFSRDIDNNKVYGGRLGIIPFTGLEIGFSAATGKASVTGIEAEGGAEEFFTNQKLAHRYKNSETAPALNNEQARDYDVLGFDFAYRHQNFQVRGEYVQTEIGAATTGITASAGATWQSWYTQASYLIPQSKWEPIVRYTDFTAAEEAGSQEQLALGLNYQFSSSVMAKATYEFNDGITGSPTDENRWLIQLAYGF